MNDRNIRILQSIECSSMVSSWREYLCLDVTDGRALLSHRRYEVLGELSEFAVETDDGDEEYRIPEVIDGQPVVGTEDEFVVGGELSADPSDPEPELDLTKANPEKVRGWLTERGFDPRLGTEAAHAIAALGRPVPSAQYGDEPECPDGERDRTEPISAASIGPVTQIRVRLQRWREIPATPENDYPAVVIKEGEKFDYRARGVTLPITEHEAVQVISNPFLYYFSTALKLHKRIEAMKGTDAATPLHSLIGECCPDWEVNELRTREDWFEALKKEFGVSGYQKEGMEEPVDFDIEDLEFAEEQPVVDVLEKQTLEKWVSCVHDPVVELGPLVNQLRELVARDTGVRLVPTVTTAGLKYCGTIESSRIRVTMKRGRCVAAVDIRPVDCFWDECVDRTFGWMWESPDDC